MSDINEEDGSGDINIRPYSFSVVPYSIGPHLEFLEFDSVGHLLLSSSNLVVRNWTGSIWLFKTGDVYPKKEECLTGHGAESPISCGTFLGSWDKLMVGEDIGKLSLLKANEYEDGSVHCVPNSSATHHDGAITSLSITSNNLTTVTAGEDLRINIWDNNKLELQEKFCPAHSLKINKVLPAYDNNSKTFLSCGSDGLVLLWDPRQANKPATGVVESTLGLNTMTWVSENIFAFGNIASEVILVDIRNKSILHGFNFDKYEIHHISANNNGWLAACSNSSTIRVWDTATNEQIFISDDHTGLVRGLCWHPINGKLYSCGFDQRVLSHEVSVI